MKKLSVLVLIGTALLASNDTFFVTAHAQAKEPAAGLVPAASSHVGAETLIELPSDLARLLRDYEQAWQRNDADALARLFTEDGFVLQNGKPPVRGREAIRAAYHGEGGSPLRLRALAYDVSGDSGSIIGTYGFGQNTTETGKFTLTLRRTADGKWLIRSDMENMNRPARTQAVATSSATPSKRRP